MNTKSAGNTSWYTVATLVKCHDYHIWSNNQSNYSSCILSICLMLQHNKYKKRYTAVVSLKLLIWSTQREHSLSFSFVIYDYAGQINNDLKTFLVAAESLLEAECGLQATLLPTCFLCWGGEGRKAKFTESSWHAVVKHVYRDGRNVPFMCTTYKNVQQQLINQLVC